MNLASLGVEMMLESNQDGAAGKRCREMVSDDLKTSVIFISRVPKLLVIAEKIGERKCER